MWCFSGQDSCEGTSYFGNSRLDFLKSYGDFTDGVPSPDVIARVMGKINPKEMQRAFIDWMNDCHELTKSEVITIDDKAVRGSYNKSRGQSAIHIVNAIAT